MTNGPGDDLPLGMRPGMNQNLLQPSFRDGARQEPRRRLWPMLVTAALAVLVAAVLVVLALTR